MNAGNQDCEPAQAAGMFPRQKAGKSASLRSESSLFVSDQQVDSNLHFSWLAWISRNQAKRWAHLHQRQAKSLNLIKYHAIAC